MAIQVRKGTGAVLFALVSGFNAIRVGLASASKYFHFDTTSSTVGDPYPRVVPAVFVSPVATDPPSLLVLCRELAGRHAYHLADAFAHVQADGTNGLANGPPIDVPTAIVFLNDAKAKWNGHIAQAGVHVNNDPQAITAPNAVDLQTSMDLANTYRAVFATHIQNAFPGSSIQVIDP
jgi:hypothetical protein